MKNCGFLQRLAVLALSSLALGATFVQSAAAAVGCPDHSLTRPFLPWLDPAYYTLAPNGGFESGSTAWSRSGGAKVVAGNEPFYVRARQDEHALSLPSGSSATSSSTCVRVLDPTVRFFARNSGSLLSTLKVDVLYDDIFGIRRAHPIALLVGTPRWTPTLPLAFLANVQGLPLVSDGTVDVAFRFTPQGTLSGWTIDDVYVDPFKGS
jgi:hypothetical protein